MTRRDKCGVCKEYVDDYAPTCEYCGISFCYECTRYKTLEGFYRAQFKQIDDYCEKSYVNRIDFETFMTIDDWGINTYGLGLDDYEIEDIYEAKINCHEYFQCDNCHENEEEISKKNSEISKLKKENNRLKILLLYNKIPVDILKHLDGFF